MEYPPEVKVGACYNVFDGEELLEASIRSIRGVVQYVCVVYQTVSNFGEKNPGLRGRLDDLVARGLVDDLVPYKPVTFSASQKKELVSPRTTGSDLGGAATSEISDQFFNELLKREVGRTKCMANQCQLFMPMDSDECYVQDQLRAAVDRMVAGGYDCGVCRMRLYFRDPRWELLPVDDLNYVPAVLRVHPSMPFRLAVPFPVLADPTRKLHNCTRVLEFGREELEMHHYSFVREDIGRKLRNVSNRANYSVPNIPRFVAEFKAWTPAKDLLCPNRHFQETFRRVRVVDNYFGIAVDAATSHAVAGSALGAAPAEPLVGATLCQHCGGPGNVRCSRCKAARYCSDLCQKAHWSVHKGTCAAPKSNPPK